MKSQLPIAEPVHLLDDQNSYDLVAAQAADAAVCLLRAAGDLQVLPDQLCDLKIFVENAGDGLQLLGVIQVEPGLA